jgi:hypothetical protein
MRILIITFGKLKCKILIERRKSFVRFKNLVVVLKLLFAQVECIH